MIISVINHTDFEYQEVQTVLRAVNRQLQEDFKKYWHKHVELRLEGWTGHEPDANKTLDMRGDAVLYLWDKEDTEDALGYHAVNHRGVPYGFVFTRLADALKEPWSVTFSHEALEMAMDAEANLLVRGPHPDDSQQGRQVNHWYEICDAVQADTYEIDGVKVSNFLLPLYFTENEEHLNHNDFLGLNVGSFKTRPGGYIGYFDPQTGDDQFYMDPRDGEAAARAEKKKTFLAGKRSGRRSGDAVKPDVYVDVECLSFELDEREAAEPMLLATELVQKSLGSRWYVRRCPGCKQEFDAIPPPMLKLTLANAWQLCHELETLDLVVFAEPSFTIPVPGESDRVDVRGRAIFNSDDDLPGTEVTTWALEQCNVPAAWEIVEDQGKTPGAGVRIGHPDSGYLEHHEMDPSRILKELDWDFLDNDADAHTRKHGRHGLSTASVIMSGSAGAVIGPANGSTILPLRVTKKGLIRPTPVLLFGGMRKLRDAVDYARMNSCGVISLSLGGTPSRSLKKAIERATEAGVIVLAAAGNRVRFVVYPARYEDTIAVAGCDINREAWTGSSRGSKVDITAPGASVWRATVTDTGAPTVGRGFGTSYAVALTAGIAALWRSHRAEELANLRPEDIPKIFRQLLLQTAQTNHSLPDGKYGAGIVDAKALLEAEIPDEIERKRRRGMRATLGTDLDELVSEAPSSLTESERLELVSTILVGRLCAESQVRYGKAERGMRAVEKVPEPMLSRALKSKLGTKVVLKD